MNRYFVAAILNFGWIALTVWPNVALAKGGLDNPVVVEFSDGAGNAAGNVVQIDPNHNDMTVSGPVTVSPPPVGYVRIAFNTDGDSDDPAVPTEDDEFETAVGDILIQTIDLTTIEHEGLCEFEFRSGIAPITSRFYRTPNGDNTPQNANISISPGVLIPDGEDFGIHVRSRTFPSGRCRGAVTFFYQLMN